MLLQPVLRPSVVVGQVLQRPVLLQLVVFPLAVTLQQQVLVFLAVMLLQSMLLPLVDGGHLHLLVKGKSSELCLYGLQIVIVVWH